MLFFNLYRRLLQKCSINLNTSNVILQSYRGAINNNSIWDLNTSNVILQFNVNTSKPY